MVLLTDVLSALTFSREINGSLSWQRLHEQTLLIDKDIIDLGGAFVYWWEIVYRSKEALHPISQSFFSYDPNASHISSL